MANFQDEIEQMEQNVILVQERDELHQERDELRQERDELRQERDELRREIEEMRRLRQLHRLRIRHGADIWRRAHRHALIFNLHGTSTRYYLRYSRPYTFNRRTRNYIAFELIR